MPPLWPYSSSDLSDSPNTLSKESLRLMQRHFAGLAFSLVGLIRPERDVDDNVVEYLPQSRYANRDNLKLNPYGHGPFCRFKIARGREWRRSGIYVLTCGGSPIYVGETVDMERRWGSNGYGSISPRNCFQRGQPTNCRLNNLILQGAKSGRVFDLWFHPIDGGKQDRLDVERMLVAHLNPSWNR